MKVNYDFYTGNDTYCDGDTEKDVISYLKEYGETGFQEVFKKDRFPSPKRWGIKKPSHKETA